jgi:4-carboxymuconolactone decarboxylase
MRIPPVDASTDGALRTVLESVGSGPHAGQELLGVLAHRPRLMARVAALGRTLDEGQALTERQRLLVMMRVAVRTRCDYLWTLQQSRHAQRCGVDSVQLRALQHLPASSPCWSEPEQLLIEATDELHKGATISGRTLDAMGRHWSGADLVEIAALIGHGYLQAFVANIAGLGPERPAAA